MKTIEQVWEEFLGQVVDPDQKQFDLKEVRWAFYAGYTAASGAISDHQKTMFKGISIEAMEFCQEVVAGIPKTD
jgi:hypothetical protein